MNTLVQRIRDLSTDRIRTTLCIATVAFFVLTPFVIYDFFQGHYHSAFGSFIIVVFSVVVAWYCIHNKYYPALIFWGLVPAVTLLVILSFREQGSIVLYWCYPILLSFYFMLPERRAWLANAVFLGIIFPYAWYVLEYPAATRFVATAMAASILSAIFVNIINNQQKMLERQAEIDPLTGLLNRMLLNKTLEQAVQLNHRSGMSMTLVTIDLDRFKTINDTFGHNIGDKVLRGIGEFFDQRIRRTDKVFRIGGEEFLVLLYDTDIEHGRKVAEELRSGSASLSLIPDQPVTISIGVTALKPGENGEEWMKRCDDKLYQAKMNGRNTIVS